MAIYKKNAPNLKSIFVLQAIMMTIMTNNKATERKTAISNGYGEFQGEATRKNGIDNNRMRSDQCTKNDRMNGKC